MDTHEFPPFRYKAFINIPKQIGRKNYKGRTELAIFLGFEDNTIPGYKLYLLLYKDFVTTAHSRFMKPTRRNDTNLNE